MLTKEKVINAVEKLPLCFSIDELFDRLILFQKIEIGMDQSVAGQTHSTEEARKILGKWLE